MLNISELLQMKRWNTPTICNGWEQITRHDPGRDGFNIEETRDFMPQMGPMVGYAVTLIVEPSNKLHRDAIADAWGSYRQYIASVPGPKIVVVQDLDRPAVIGSFWGEVNANVHRALGCVGTITDGAIRDLDEMTAAGFKALARRLCVAHAHVVPVRWNCPVEVFGRAVRPGQLIHADKHGFLAVPEGEEATLLDAAKFMDDNECKTVIAATTGISGMSTESVLRQINDCAKAFITATTEKFGARGEW